MKLVSRFHSYHQLPAAVFGNKAIDDMQRLYGGELQPYERKLPTVESQIKTLERQKVAMPEARRS
jgi:hypothetical protein